MSEEKAGSFRDTISDWKDNVLFLVETLSEGSGDALTLMTPLMTQVGSALAVGFAVEENVYRLTDSRVAAVIAGGLVAVAVEGVSFTAVTKRDKAEAHNRRTSDPAQQVDVERANQLVNQSFWVTLLIVVVLESVPALLQWLWASMDTQEALFRMGLAVLPFLSRIGARLFSFAAIVNDVDTSADDRELRRLRLKLQKEELMTKHQARVRAIEAGKSASKSAPASAPKLAPKSAIDPATSGEPMSEADAAEAAVADAVADAGRRAGREEQLKMLTIYQEDPTISDERMAARIGWSKKTVQTLLDELREKEVVDVQREGKGKRVTVNGKLPAFLAGEV